MKLRPYQEEAIQALWDSWRENPHGAPVLCCPTGSGKSLILSSIIKQISEKHPKYRFIVATHVKELVKQNADEYFNITEGRPGIYSSGLGVKQIQRVTFAGIQSIYRRKDLEIDMLIIDECHLLSKDDNSMYQKFISNLKALNPRLKIMGLTATPMRMDQGSLVGENSTFTEIAYDISIRRLIEEGYLSPILSVAKKSVDLSGVKTSGIDYNKIDLENAFNREELIKAHVSEIIENGKDRKSWLIFCAGIKHAEDVTEELKRQGINADYVTGEMPAFVRDFKIGDFKDGKTTALVNVGILTTGFNAPQIDLLAILRATKSTSLYLQIVGRGTRTALGKRDCLVLDFGGNIDRHGPIDCVTINQKKGQESKIGIAPSKKCERCGCVVAIRVTACPACGMEFPEGTKELELKASSAPILSKTEEYEVKNFDAKIHKKDGKPDSLRLMYYLDEYRYLSEFLCFQHGGIAARVAVKKWALAAGTHPPKTAREALERRDELKMPNKITVLKKDKYPEIVDITYKLPESEDLTYHF
jgi:DNA repair protein RadD